MLSNAKFRTCVLDLTRFVKIRGRMRGQISSDLILF